MIVYRLCREDEIQKILRNLSFEGVGYYCRNNEKNSHTYNEDIKYMHFFKNKTDLLYLNTLMGRFICVYDIPEELLLKHFGYGKYYDYIRFATLKDVEEFAIPSDNIRFNYLQSINKIIKDIDYEEMYEKFDLREFLQEIYNHVSLCK
ncbi:MAG: hypothetical protein E7345_00205 [Clostridiales bacterium]|nr:hypothetical protein [Clostridiales bacterium]